jgi:hypothetical protein
MMVACQFAVSAVSAVSYIQREKSVRKNITDSFRTAPERNRNNRNNRPSLFCSLPDKHSR